MIAPRLPPLIDMTDLAAVLESKLRAALNPAHLEVVNESHHHSRPGNDTHFRVVVVADVFEGQRLITRQQRIYQLLDAEMKGGIHALTMHVFTPAEWQERQQQTTPSPRCHGGSKADRP